MYTVGFVGDLPGRRDDKMSGVIDRVVDLLDYQYGGDIVFNFDGGSFLGLYGANKCVENNFKFNLYLPHTVDVVADIFSKDESSVMVRCAEAARSLVCSNISEPISNSIIFSNQKNIINNSSFIISFWSGCKHGPYFDALMHAFDNSMIVIDGAGELKMLSKQSIL